MKAYINVLTITLAALLIAVLLACQSFSLPSVVNFFDNAQKLKQLYCSEIMADVRESILAKIREKHPDHPEHGFCGYVMPEKTIAAAPII